MNLQSKKQLFQISVILVSSVVKNRFYRHVAQLN
jgi:hypothetical protein